MVKASSLLVQVGEAFAEGFRYLREIGGGIAHVSLPNGNSARIRLVRGTKQVYYNHHWINYDPCVFPAEAFAA